MLRADRNVRMDNEAIYRKGPEPSSSAGAGGDTDMVASGSGTIGRTGSGTTSRTTVRVRAATTKEIEQAAAQSRRSSASKAAEGRSDADTTLTSGSKPSIASRNTAAFSKTTSPGGTVVRGQNVKGNAGGQTVGRESPAKAGVEGQVSALGLRNLVGGGTATKPPRPSKFDSNMGVQLTTPADLSDARFAKTTLSASQPGRDRLLPYESPGPGYEGVDVTVATNAARPRFPGAKGAGAKAGAAITKGGRFPPPRRSDGTLLDSKPPPGTLSMADLRTLYMKVRTYQRWYHTTAAGGKACRCAHRYASARQRATPTPLHSTRPPL